MISVFLKIIKAIQNYRTIGHVNHPVPRTIVSERREECVPVLWEETGRSVCMCVFLRDGGRGKQAREGERERARGREGVRERGFAACSLSAVIRGR